MKKALIHLCWIAVVIHAASGSPYSGLDLAQDNYGDFGPLLRNPATGGALVAGLEAVPGGFVSGVYSGPGFALPPPGGLYDGPPPGVAGLGYGGPGYGEPDYGGPGYGGPGLGGPGYGPALYPPPGPIITDGYPGPIGPGPGGPIPVGGPGFIAGPGPGPVFTDDQFAQFIPEPAGPGIPPPPPPEPVIPAGGPGFGGLSGPASGGSGNNVNTLGGGTIDGIIDSSNTAFSSGSGLLDLLGLANSQTHATGANGNIFSVATSGR